MYYLRTIGEEAGTTDISCNGTTVSLIVYGIPNMISELIDLNVECTNHDTGETQKVRFLEAHFIITMYSHRCAWYVLQTQC